MKKQIWKPLLRSFATLAGLLFFTALIFPIFGRARRTDRKSSCQSNLKQIGLGLAQYIQDYDEKYPPAATPNGGWVAGIYPYTKSTLLFQCPTEPDWEEPVETDGKFPFEPTASGVTDYFYNSRMQKRSVASIERASCTLLNGEGNDGQETTDASYSKSSLSAEWRSDKSSPAYRHLDGANYAFVDGHVKWLRPTSIVDRGGMAEFGLDKSYFNPDPVFKP